MTGLGSVADRLAPLRLRTPRLVLRAPTLASVEALYEVAAAGIHPPAEMPFSVAWTDDLTRESFLAHHRAVLEWTEDAWRLNLVTHLDGAPIGSQTIQASDFRERRVVETGSWLGAPFQGRGFGTEMRAAVLELAFGALAAVAATSGAMDDNTASQRVSARLGYRVVGRTTVAPRGVPVAHRVYRLDAADWRCPLPVEVEGVDALQSLLGL